MQLKRLYLSQQCISSANENVNVARVLSFPVIIIISFFYITDIVVFVYHN